MVPFLMTVHCSSESGTPIQFVTVKVLDVWESHKVLVLLADIVGTSLSEWINILVYVSDVPLLVTVTERDLVGLGNGTSRPIKSLV